MAPLRYAFELVSAIPACIWHMRRPSKYLPYQNFTQRDAPQTVIWNRTVSSTGDSRWPAKQK